MAGHVCPWWLGYFLINPLRRIYQSPRDILDGYVKPGMTVLDIGPGMGFFSLWMAQAVGETGRVVCVDVQQKMIDTLKRRAAKRGLKERIDARVCGESNMGIDDLSGRVDFALAFAVMHEVPDQSILLGQIFRALKPGGRCLLAEPAGHVSTGDFDATEKLAVRAGFGVAARPGISRSRALLLSRDEQ